jgi:hypothetical protein
MSRIFLFLVITLFAFASAFSQSKSNDEINKQIRHLNVQKNITVSYDGSTSKVMAVADNFSEKDSSRAGIQAMNFAIGFFFFGDKLQSAPDPILLTFWVLSKKPRFTADYDVTIDLGNEVMSLGEVRYAAKPRENMEYLNCKITREQLERIVKNPGPTVRIGQSQFKFSPDQTQLLEDLLNVSNPEISY